LNGKSQGRKKKGAFEYRLRWDEVVYEPGELKVVAYKDGMPWATETVKTTGEANRLLLSPDRSTIAGDGHDLSFVKLTVADADGLMVPRSKNLVHFTISGPGEIVATDNGDPTDLSSFQSGDRKAFNGLALVIVKAKRGQTGPITVTAKSDGLAEAAVTITTK
jgi:beta-galactosidase